MSSAHRSADWPIPPAPNSGMTGQCRGEARSDQKAELGPSWAHRAAQRQPGWAEVREAQHEAGPGPNSPELREEGQTLSLHMDMRQGRGRRRRRTAQWGGTSGDHPGGCLAGGWPLGVTSPPRSTISSPSPCGMCGLWAEAVEHEVTRLHLPRQALCCPEKCHPTTAGHLSRVPVQGT